MTMQSVYVEFTADLSNLGVEIVSNGISDDHTPMAVLLLDKRASAHEIVQHLNAYFVIDDWYEDRGPDIGRFLVVLGLEYRNG